MDHPFIINLLGTTMDEAKLYFIFETCKNGDLAGLLEKRRKKPSECLTRIYREIGYPNHSSLCCPTCLHPRVSINTGDYA